MKHLQKILAVALIAISILTVALPVLADIVYDYFLDCQHCGSDNMSYAEVGWDLDWTLIRGRCLDCYGVTTFKYHE